EELGRLEGLHAALVGDVLHSRVARSLIQPFTLVGIRTTLVGPPALLPRQLPAETTSDIDAIRDTDVVYVLRMQTARMQPGGRHQTRPSAFAARASSIPPKESTRRSTCASTTALFLRLARASTRTSTASSMRPASCSRRRSSIHMFISAPPDAKTRRQSQPEP